MSVQVNDQNLGHATAYGYASSKGYTGTEDEFAELMASYADVAEQAAESAEQAAASATTATAKASEAAQSATAAASSKTAAETAQGGAETAAQTATTKAGEASASATTASGKATEATTAAGTATTKASEATTAATTATTKAGEASTSATNAAASATRAQEILDSIPADYSQLSDDVADLKDGLKGLKYAISGTGANAGGYTYPCIFTPGKQYFITNTSSNTLINANTYGNGGIIEAIKNNIAIGETLIFVPTKEAPQIRIYYSTSGGSFSCVSGEVPNLVEDVNGLKDKAVELDDLQDNVLAMKLVKTVNFGSGLYSGPIPSIGDTYNKTVTTNSAWECIKLEVSKYDRVSLYGGASASTPLWVYTDKENKVLSAVSGAVTYTANSPLVMDFATDGYLYINSVASVSHGAIHHITNGFDVATEEIKEFVKSNKAIYPLEFDFDNTKIPEQSDFVITSRDPQDIYDLYDGLMAQYPEYITKVDCSDADSSIGVTRPSYLSGYPIYLYKFSPNIVLTDAAIKRKMKIMVLTGVHSNEKWNVYNVYKILKYICENWGTDKNAETIRTLVEYWIIPMVNPWGWANAGLVENAGRVNGNGVNLNRNAPASNWTLTSQGADYSGPSAGSEYETKIWLYYHDLFKPDVFIDQHTPGMPDTGIFGVLETDITQEYLANAGDVICREISNHMIKADSNTPDSPDTVLFDMYSDTNYGAVTLCAREHGTPYSFLFEFSDSSKWSNGVLTTSTVTGASSGVQIRLQMQNIYGAWQRLLYYASRDIFHRIEE